MPSRIALRLLALSTLAVAADPPRAEARGEAQHVVVIVWDGLRPDFVTRERTPALWQLAREGVTFQKHHSAYPTSTIVNGAVIATGQPPRCTGIIANSEFREQIDPFAPIRTEKAETVREGDRQSKGRYLGADTIAEMLHARGERTLVVGTKPVALLHDRRLDRTSSAARGSINFFAGKSLLAEALDAFSHTLGGFPPQIAYPNTAQDNWSASVFLAAIQRDGLPRFSLLWLSEPDYSQHKFAPGAAPTLAGLKGSDDNLARVLALIETKGWRKKTDIFVVSDHGFSTISRAIDVAEILRTAGFNATRRFTGPPVPGEIMVVGNGGTALLYVTGHDRQTIGHALAFFQQSDIAGVIFTREPHEGTFTLAEGLLDLPSAPDIVVALRWSIGAQTIPGLIISDDPDRKTGEGHHASLSAYDLHNTLIAAGPDFAPGTLSEIPSGNIDLAPTILGLLGIQPTKEPVGRVLAEALVGWSKPEPILTVKRLETVASTTNGLWKQYLKVSRVDRSYYFDEGNGQPEAPPYTLSDPDAHIRFPISGQFLPNRPLGHVDFDIQRRVAMADGTFWMVDVLGPFLLHAAKDGRLLAPPIALPDPDRVGAELRTWKSPAVEEGTALRLMTAFQRNARQRGHYQPLVVSPDALLLRDGSLRSRVDHRWHSPANPKLRDASSEIFDVSALQRAGFSVIPYTVNDKPRMHALMRLGVNGIISDRPDLLREAIEEFDSDGDGTPGDFLTSEGLIDPVRFDAQGHRGARNLRPENTLPAMEAALDNLVTTLETDCAVTRDGFPILSHDPFLAAEKFSHADHTTYNRNDEVLIREIDASELQDRFRCKLLPGRGQTNLPRDSPVSLAFFDGDESRIFTPPTLDQLFAFVKRYASHYREGAGRNHRDGCRRAAAAERVRFNIETKTNPRGDSDSRRFDQRVIAFRDRTHAPAVVASAVAKAIVKNSMVTRADIQSFDFRTLLHIHEQYPKIRTVWLFGDFPRYANPDLAGSDDGTNLQGEGTDSSPWLGGLTWPYRASGLDQPLLEKLAVESFALNDDGTSLQLSLSAPPSPVGLRRMWRWHFDVRTFEFAAR